jgi:hypothetical protein
MRSHEIEAWALRVIDRVLADKPVEDFRVELKGDWIDGHKAARRIAGHANAAGGESILWIIGIEEKSGLTDIKAADFATWWAGVQSRFDGLSPTVRELHLEVSGKALVALLFETDRAPFLVKNPAGGEISREVPWREATAVRSATRNDLVKVLSPSALMPDFEILYADVAIRDVKDNHPSGGMRRVIQLHSQIYVTPLRPERQVFPFHRASARVTNPSTTKEILTFTDIDLTVPVTPTMAAHGFGTTSSTLQASTSELIIDGPGLFEFRSRITIKSDARISASALLLEMRIQPARVDRVIVLTAQLTEIDAGKEAVQDWRL